MVRAGGSYGVVEQSKFVPQLIADQEAHMWQLLQRYKTMGRDSIDFEEVLRKAAGLLELPPHGEQSSPPRWVKTAHKAGPLRPRPQQCTRPSAPGPSQGSA